MRAPASKVTRLPAARAGAVAGKSGSIWTTPVNQFAEPGWEGWVPLHLISMVGVALRIDACGLVGAPGRQRSVTVLARPAADGRDQRARAVG